MKGFIDLDRAKRALAERDLDALLVTSLQGVYYLTGLPAWFTSRNRLVFILEKLSPVAAVLTADGKISLVGPASIWEHAHETASFDTLYTSATSMHMERAHPITPTAQGFLDTLVVALRESKAQRVAIEAHHMSLEYHQGLTAALPGVRFSHEGKAILETLKLRKTPREIELLRKASLLTEKSIAASFAEVRAGATERHIHEVVLRVLLEGGGDWNQTTVAAGAAGANPFRVATDYVLKPGDFIRYDIGGTYGGYCSDLARVAVIGEPDREAQRLYDTLRAGEEAAVSIVKPGVTFGQIYAAGMGSVWEHGYPQFRRGNIGHTIGIELEEEPFITKDSTLALEPGMVIAIELPWYAVGRYGFNVEDIILVTQTGHELLSPTLSRALYRSKPRRPAAARPAPHRRAAPSPRKGAAGPPRRRSTKSSQRMAARSTRRRQ